MEDNNKTQVHEGKLERIQKILIYQTADTTDGWLSTRALYRQSFDGDLDRCWTEDYEREELVIWWYSTGGGHYYIV